MKTFYFTFGFGHCVGPGLAYTWIECEHAEGARAQMFAEYKNKWAFMYDSAEAAGVHRFNLMYIPFGSHEGLL